MPIEKLITKAREINITAIQNASPTSISPAANGLFFLLNEGDHFQYLLYRLIYNYPMRVMKTTEIQVVN